MDFKKTLNFSFMNTLAKALVDSYQGLVDMELTLIPDPNNKFNFYFEMALPEEDACIILTRGKTESIELAVWNYGDVIELEMLTSEKTYLLLSSYIWSIFGLSYSINPKEAADLAYRQMRQPVKDLYFYSINHPAITCEMEFSHLRKRLKIDHKKAA